MNRLFLWILLNEKKATVTLLSAVGLTAVYFLGLCVIGRHHHTPAIYAVERVGSIPLRVADLVQEEMIDAWREFAAPQPTLFNTGGTLRVGFINSAPLYIIASNGQAYLSEGSITAQPRRNSP